ncbi:MAG: 2-C-methyl-D-erythritol 4-phosphate cytidylyltransferase [Nitrospirae bacterium]|nr:2-C-methyl-D-erythritol 4-phosphate cytidylyltransferase [Nitrospirota bacterium]
MTPRVTAVIPAAGFGRRMEVSTPKQFLLLDGVPVLVHTLRVFEVSPLIHDVCLVVPPGMEPSCRVELIDSYGLKKVSRIVPGGETRQASVYQGLMKTSPDADQVVVHDGVRPFLTTELLQRLLEAAKDGTGVIAAVPLKDTPKEIREDGTIVSTPDRARLVLAQTPQVFSRKVLMEAHQKAYADGVLGTDDSALVERLGHPVRMIEGSWDNIKITTPEDLRWAERILEMRQPGIGRK